MSSINRKKVQALAAGAIALGTGLAIVTVGGGQASASPVPVSASGASTIALGGKAISLLQGGGCGVLSATAYNGATLLASGKQTKVVFPVSGFAYEPGTGAIEVDHSGGIELMNDCYDISINNVRIEDYGMADQGTVFDLNARYNSDDDSGRAVLGELDLTNANVSFTQNGATRIAKADLYTSDEGAEELNELAVGGDGTTGPFTSDMKIGNAKTRVKFDYAPAV